MTPKYFDGRKWSIAHAKVSKELKPFTGVDAHYRTWANRIKDHFKEHNARKRREKLDNDDDRDCQHSKVSAQAHRLEPIITTAEWCWVRRTSRWVRV